MEGKDRKWHELYLHWPPEQHSSEVMCTRLRLWHNIKFSFVSAVFRPLLCSLRGSFITPLNYVLTVDLIYCKSPYHRWTNSLSSMKLSLYILSLMPAVGQEEQATLCGHEHLCSMWCSVEKPPCCSQSLLEAKMIFF